MHPRNILARSRQLGRVFAMAIWTVATPTSPVTLAHIVLRAVTERAGWNREGAADLAAAYRFARAALGHVFGRDGFTVVFALGWRPSGAGIGEPASEGDGAVHVFGRYEGEPLKPSAAMSVAVDDRPAAPGDGRLRAALAVSSIQQPTIPAPTVGESGRDGCIDSVRTFKNGGDVRASESFALSVRLSVRTYWFCR